MACAAPVGRSTWAALKQNRSELIPGQPARVLSVRFDTVRIGFNSCYIQFIMIANPSRSSSHKRAPGRPRSHQARQSILDSTLELLQQTGFEALSIEGIAAHAG